MPVDGRNVILLQPFNGRFMGDFKRVEAAALHERNLIEKDVSDCPDFTGKSMMLAQPYGLGIGPAIGKCRKGQRNQGELVQEADDFRNVIAGFQAFIGVRQQSLRPRELVFIDHDPPRQYADGALEHAHMGVHHHMGDPRLAQQRLDEGEKDNVVASAKLFHVQVPRMTT